MPDNERTKNKEVSESDKILADSYPLLTKAAGRNATLDIHDLELGVSTLEVYTSKEKNDTATFTGFIRAYTEGTNPAAMDPTLTSLIQSLLVLPYLASGEVFGLDLNIEGYNIPPNTKQAELQKIIIKRYYDDATANLPPMTTANETQLGNGEIIPDATKDKRFRRILNAAKRVVGTQGNPPEN